jgi:uncharacterized protein YqfB (UPF0267 family)
MQTILNPFTINPEKKINFLENYNGKMGCHFFTTIRLDEPEYKVGEFYQIWRKEIDSFTVDEEGKPLVRNVYSFKGRIVEKKTFLMEQLPSITAAQDTGLGLPETKALLRKLYPDADFSTQLLTLLLIQNIEWKL